MRLDASCDTAVADDAQLEELLTEILSGAAAAGRSTTIATFSGADTITVRIAFGRIEGIEPEGVGADASLWRAIVQANQGVFRIESATDGAVAIEFTLPLAVRGARGLRSSHRLPQTDGVQKIASPLWLARITKQRL